MDLFIFLFCLVLAMSLCASVYMCFVVTCWERADLWALVCGVKREVCQFLIGILGQVWYLIVSIPGLCTLTYFYNTLLKISGIFLNSESHSHSVRHHQTFYVPLLDQIY